MREIFFSGMSDADKNESMQGDETKSVTKPKAPQKRVSIDTKMVVMLSVLVFVAVGSGLLFASFQYLREKREDFSRRVEQSVSMHAEEFDYHEVREFSVIAASEDFQKTRKEHLNDGEALVRELAARSSNDPDFSQTILGFFMSRIRDMELRLSIDDMYLCTCRESACYFVFGSDQDKDRIGETLPYRFSREDLTEQDLISTNYYEDESFYDDEKPHVRMVAMYRVNSEEAQPEAEDVWLVSEMDQIVLERLQNVYLADVFIFLIIVTFACTMVGVTIFRYTLTVPIISIQEDAVKFTSMNNAENEAQPLKLKIESNDEIEDLSIALYRLEKNVVETQQELRKNAEEQGRHNAQMMIATRIQQGVLPRDFPDHDCIDLYALMDPAKEVGGDFYDFFFLNDHQLALVIGDVSDKGIPSALFMMTCKTLIKARAGNHSDPAEILEAVSSVLLESNPEAMFVTVWMGILDLTTGRMIATNAGHEYPMLKRRDEPFELYKDKHGLALAIMKNSKYTDYEIQLNPGDRLLVYSNGATDAVNPRGDAFGMDRLLRAAQQASVNSDSCSFVSALRRSLEDYSAGAGQFDDITLLSLTFLKKAEPAPAEEPGDAQQKPEVQPAEKPEEKADGKTEKKPEDADV